MKEYTDATLHDELKRALIRKYWSIDEGLNYLSVIEVSECEAKQAAPNHSSQTGKIAVYNAHRDQIITLWRDTDHREEPRVSLENLRTNTTEYRVLYFINWAIKRGIKIHWIDWAIKEGLVPSDIADEPLIDDLKGLQSRLKEAENQIKQLRTEKKKIETERDTLFLTVNNNKLPSDRSESTYQNIIAALLDCIAGGPPHIKKHPSFISEAKLIEAIAKHYDGYSGLSQSNLSRKFPEAKRSLESK